MNLLTNISSANPIIKCDKEHSKDCNENGHININHSSILNNMTSS